LVERNLAKVEVESSRLFSRSSIKRKRSQLPFIFSEASVEVSFTNAVSTGQYLYHAGVAQLVERNLAKVEVESSRLFSRSKFRREALPASFFLARSLSKIYSAIATQEARF
jgi:hypothetical protein